MSGEDVVLVVWAGVVFLLGLVWLAARMSEHIHNVDPEPEHVQETQENVHDTLRIAIQGLVQVNADQLSIVRESLAVSRARDALEASSAQNSYLQTKTDAEAMLAERMADIQRKTVMHSAKQQGQDAVVIDGEVFIPR